MEEARWRREPARNSETIEQAPPLPSGTASETPTDADSKIGAGRDFGGPSEPGNQGEQPRGAWDPRWVLALAVVAIVGLAGGLLYFTGLDSSPASPEESSTASQPVALGPTPAPTVTPTPTITPFPTPATPPCRRRRSHRFQHLQQPLSQPPHRYQHPCRQNVPGVTCPA